MTSDLAANARRTPIWAEPALSPPFLGLMAAIGAACWLVPWWLVAFHGLAMLPAVPVLIAINAVLVPWRLGVLRWRHCLVAFVAAFLGAVAGMVVVSWVAGVTLGPDI
jgi:hypothetical protein